MNQGGASILATPVSNHTGRTLDYTGRADTSRQRPTKASKKSILALCHKADMSKKQDRPSVEPMW